MALGCIVLHAKVVPHLVGHGGGHHCRVGTVLHAHSSGVLIRTDRTLQGFAHNAAIEDLLGQQLGIVVGVFQHQFVLPIVQKVTQRHVAVLGELDLVGLVPDHHAHQSHIYIQGHIELKEGEKI